MKHLRKKSCMLKVFNHKTDFYRCKAEIYIFIADKIAAYDMPVFLEVLVTLPLAKIIPLILSIFSKYFCHCLCCHTLLLLKLNHEHFSSISFQLTLSTEVENVCWISVGINAFFHPLLSFLALWVNPTQGMCITDALFMQRCTTRSSGVTVVTSEVHYNIWQDILSGDTTKYQTYRIGHWNTNVLKFGQCLNRSIA